MATIPTVVHIGNAELNGALPKPEVQPLAAGGGWLFWYNRYRLCWSIPADPATGLLPVSVTHKPWYDVTYGDWVPYHHVAGLLSAPYNTATGDNTTAPGYGGFGSSAAYMQKFADYYSASPYFKAIKLAYPGRVTSEWKSAGSSRTSFGTQWSNAVSDASPDTLDVKCIIIDCSGALDGDIANWGSAASTYQTDLTALISHVRTTVGNSNALVILITHATNYLATTGGVGAFAVAQIHFELSRTLTNVVVLPMYDDELGTSTGAYGDLVPGADRRSYNQQAYIRQGNEIFDLYLRSISSVAANNSKYIPFFIHIGDSQAVGTMSAVLVSQLGSPEVQGPRDDEYIYNGLTQSIEKINPGVNTNTLGTVSTNIGSILTLTEQLHEKYPDGYVLFHMAKNGSAVSGTGLATYSSSANGRWGKYANENYTQMQTALAIAMNRVLEQTGAVQIEKVPLLHGIFIELGDNDTYNEYSASIFLNSLKELIRSLRDDFGGKLWGLEVPVILVRPHVSSALGVASARVTVRAAFDTAKADLSLVDYISVDDLNHSADEIHYGAQTHITLGYRMFDKYIEMIESLVPSP